MPEWVARPCQRPDPVSTSWPPAEPEGRDNSDVLFDDAEGRIEEILRPF